jgi:hypothetical protein
MGAVSQLLQSPFSNGVSFISRPKEFLLLSINTNIPASTGITITDDIDTNHIKVVHQAAHLRRLFALHLPMAIVLAPIVFGTSR